MNRLKPFVAPVLRRLNVAPTPAVEVLHSEETEPVPPVAPPRFSWRPPVITS